MSTPTPRPPAIIVPATGITAGVVNTPDGKRVELRLVNDHAHAMIVLDHEQTSQVLDGLAAAHAQTSGIITPPAAGLVMP
jgi:hypothetical protein